MASFGHSNGRGASTMSDLAGLDQDHERLLALMDQLLDAVDCRNHGTSPILTNLITLTEQQAGKTERLLQKAHSDALIGVRRSHEALLLQLEMLQDLRGASFNEHLRRVAAYLPALLAQDAAAVRRSVGAAAATAAE